MSEQTISQRFVKAWGSISNPELDGENSHFKNKYASLKATLSVIRKACEPNGIAYVQTLVRSDGDCEFRSFVRSVDGDEIELSAFPVEQPPNPQAFGSNLTYTKRQQAQADWGITGEDDDDGNAAAEAAMARSGRSDAKGGGIGPDTRVDPVKAAKSRLWRAIKVYAEKEGKIPEDVLEEVKGRSDYAETKEFLALVAEEIESTL